MMGKASMKPRPRYCWRSPRKGVHCAARMGLACALIANFVHPCITQGIWTDVVMPDLVDAVPSFNAFLSAPITIIGSGFVSRAGDYECTFRTDFTICSSFSTTPATFCNEPEVRTSTARVASRSMLICNSPSWNLPGMQMSFEVRKAGVPLYKDDFFELVSAYAFINSTIPSIAGASGKYNGVQRTITLMGAGFDAYPSFTGACSLCYQSPHAPLYTCLFVGLQEKIETRVLDILSVNQVVCELPTWRHAQGFVDVHLLHAQQPVRSRAVLSFIHECESIDRTELSVLGGGEGEWDVQYSLPNLPLYHHHLLLLLLSLPSTLPPLTSSFLSTHFFIPDASTPSALP